MPSLRSLAHRIAPAFSDVVSADDVLGELALLAHERWLPEYVDRARRGEARVSVETFLRDRLRDHLRELRRRHQRRAALLAPLSEHELFVAHPPRPDEVLEAAELERRAASGVTERTVLTMRAAGYDQSEIAAATKLSRPTVSRRLAAIAALMVGLGLLLLAAAQWRGRTAEPIASEPREAPTTRPAAGTESSGDSGPSRPTSSLDEKPSPGPSNPRTSDLFDPWANDVDEARALRERAARRASRTDDVLDPWSDGPRRSLASNIPAEDTNEGELRIPEIFRTPPRTGADRAATPPSSELMNPFAESNPRSRTPRDSRRTTQSSADLMNPFTSERGRRGTTAANATEGTGTLVVHSMPWGRVLVDGRVVGNTPLTTELPVGPHKVEIHFPDGGVHDVRIETRPGLTDRIIRRQ